MPQTYLRAMYAYLGLALHHLELAEQDYYCDNEIEKFLDLEIVFQDLRGEIRSIKSSELRSFERVSPDLFLRLLSFADAPPLMRSTQVSMPGKGRSTDLRNSSAHSRWKGKESRSARDWRSSPRSPRVR